MRVITGIAKGRRLETLEGTDVRPTTDMVKEAVFSAVQFEIEERSFLDLFAGSGQMGIEALSRGANSAVFIDANPDSVQVIKNNLKKTGLENSAKVIRSDYFSYLAAAGQKFDIAFLDPPYRLNILEKALSAATTIMNDSGVIICEHPLDIELPKSINGFNLNKSKRYGKISISIYRKDSE